MLKISKGSLKITGRVKKMFVSGVTFPTKARAFDRYLSFPGIYNLVRNISVNSRLYSKEIFGHESKGLLAPLEE
jgi:hypothetical protein